jgi:hypothetical protein
MVAREALIAIRTVFEASEGHLTDGGFELSSNQYSLVLAILKSGLKNESELNNA